MARFALVVLTETFYCERLSASMMRETCARRRAIAVSATRTTKKRDGVNLFNLKRAGVVARHTEEVATACRSCEVGDVHLEAWKKAT